MTLLPHKVLINRVTQARTVVTPSPEQRELSQTDELNG